MSCLLDYRRRIWWWWFGWRHPWRRWRGWWMGCGRWRSGSPPWLGKLLQEGFNDKVLLCSWITSFMHDQRVLGLTSHSVLVSCEAYNFISINCCNLRWDKKDIFLINCTHCCYMYVYITMFRQDFVFRFPFQNICSNYYLPHGFHVISYQYLFI